MKEFRVQAINRHRMLTDGEGVTTLVGLYGCPLHCKYCINADILSKPKFTVFRPEQLWENVKIDYCYFLSTGGGLTFGGGESLLYTDAILDLMDILPEGVSVNLETSLNCETPHFTDIMRRVDSLIIDVKSLEENIYQIYTGQSVHLMKERLNQILANGFQEKCKLRVPIIPGLVEKAAALADAEILRNMGFSNVQVFPYVIRDYMKTET